MTIEYVTGKNKGKVVLYALSTCGWCNKTKELLREMGIEFSYIYVDLLDGQGREDAISAMEKWNPRGSFPTLVINDKHCIVGFHEDEIREALGK
jgi:glutaredoxin